MTDVPATVTDVKSGAVTLDSPITGLVKGNEVGFARPSLSFAITNVSTQAGVMGVTVLHPEAFKPGDVVLSTTGGAPSVPVTVQSIDTGVLTLTTPITGLTTNDVFEPRGPNGHDLRCGIEAEGYAGQGRYPAGLPSGGRGGSI